MKVTLLCTRIQECTHLTLGPPPGLMCALMFSLWQWILERQHTQEVLHIAFTACNKSIRSEKGSRRYCTTSLPQHSLWKGLRLGEEGRKERDVGRARIYLYLKFYMHLLWLTGQRQTKVERGRHAVQPFTLCAHLTKYTWEAVQYANESLLCCFVLFMGICWQPLWSYIVCLVLRNGRERNKLLYVATLWPWSSYLDRTLKRVMYLHD